MSALFSPLQLRSLELRNRIVVSPMCQYSAEMGQATDWHEIHLGQMALSGAGLMFLEATGVEPVGRITPGCLGLWDDVTEAALARVLQAVRRHSSMPIGIQLSHAGRKASSNVPWHGGTLISVADGGWQPEGPSAVAVSDAEPAPLALDTAGMNRIREAFVGAAKRALRLGLQAIEIHMAHGYLLHQFLSPIANHRTDEYGGAFEHRVRYPLEIFDALRALLPADFPLGVRISASDWVEGGWDLEQSVELARLLKARGCDWIDASSGGVSPRQKIALGPGYQLPFAETIKRETGITTIAVGLITEAQQAERIIADGQADMVALARAMLYDPRWPWHAAATLGGQVEAPPQYWRAQPSQFKTLFGEIKTGQR